MEVKSLIRIENLTKTYGDGRTEVHALSGLNLEIPRGAFWSIMGPSGSGKSTLLHILGLLDRPTSGTLSIATTQISSETNLTDLARLRRDLVGFIFQQFFLLPRLTALENVALPMLYKGEKPKQSHQRAKELLTRVGLSERIDHYPNQLSGGEQQRVAIARAIANDPAIILADEPTGNLDTASGKSILDLIKSLHQEGKTILLITHDDDVGRQAEKIIHLRDGKLLEK